MESLIKPGRILFAIAIAFFGFHYLTYASGITFPPPGPPWFPGAHWVAWLAGAGLFVAGVSLLFNIRARWPALLLGIALLLRVLLIHLPKVLANLHDPGPWTTTGEVLSICGGALVLAGALAHERGAAMPGRAMTTTLVGQYLYAFPLFIVGVQHFLYARFVATLVPTWIPGHLFWAYFIGVAFFGSALAIITRQFATLASSLLGLMFLLWVLLLHFPRVAASPHNGNEWTSAFIALAMSGAAFLVAGTLTKSD
jgi:hypothetical protein